MLGHLSFFVLGALTVHGERGEIALGGNRQRILLTMLLIEANRVVGVERLIDAIWGEAPPSSARSQIRICVSGLRRLLTKARAAASIETHPSGGYQLRVSQDAVDLYHFENLVARARTEAREAPSEAVALQLQEALGLWRGPIGAGLDSALLETVALKYHEDRHAAIECRFELELQLGQHRQVLGELARCVAQHPFRETLCAQLMLALHRSGRTAEALALYRDTSRRFTEELGIEPGARLRELEQLILGGEAGQEPLVGLLRREPIRPVVPCPETAAVSDLTPEDRIALLEEELAALREEHARSLRGLSGRA